MADSESIDQGVKIAQQLLGGNPDARIILYHAPVGKIEHNYYGSELPKQKQANLKLPKGETVEEIPYKIKEGVRMLMADMDNDGLPIFLTFVKAILEVSSEQSESMSGAARLIGITKQSFSEWKKRFGLQNV